MKKKVSLLLLVIIISFGIVFCFYKEILVSPKIAGLQKELYTLKKENERLTDQLTELQHNVKRTPKHLILDPDSPDTWDDYMAIAFSNRYIKNDVKELFGEETGNITYGMVKNISEFTTSCSDIDSIRYFTGLEKLILWGSEDITPIANLNNLKELKLNVIMNLEDLSVLHNLQEVTDLSISYCTRLEDISELGNLNKLDYLEIIGCNSLSTFNGLDISTSIQELRIIDCRNLVDISAIGNMKNLKNLYIESCPNLTDISPLMNLTGIESLSVIDCGCEDYSTDEEILNRPQVPIEEYVPEEKPWPYIDSDYWDIPQ